MRDDDLDIRLQAWRPLQVGTYVKIGKRKAGAYSGCLVRVIARHDDLLSGMGRYTVEIVAPHPLAKDAPLRGHDPAGQYAGSRLDVCRYELVKASNSDGLGLARMLAKRSREDVADDRDRDLWHWRRELRGEV